MKKKVLTLALLAIVCCSMIASYSPADAGVRNGCASLNIPQYDYKYYSAYNGTAYFHAGDTIYITATWTPHVRPVFGTTNIVLRINDVAMSVDTVPGALKYVFPADTFAAVEWYNAANIMLDWETTCTPG